MIKFVVICYRRPDWSREQFRRYFVETHGPLAMAMPSVVEEVVVQHLEGRSAGRPIAE